MLKNNKKIVQINFRELPGILINNQKDCHIIIVAVFLV